MGPIEFRAAGWTELNLGVILKPRIVIITRSYISGNPLKEIMIGRPEVGCLCLEFV